MTKNPLLQLALIVIGLLWLFHASVRGQSYTDPGSPANPVWSSIFSTLK